MAPIARRHELVVTHSNGPQVGLLALQAAAYGDARPYPLDVLGAESEGMIGYLVDLALGDALPDRDIATLLTQVEVAPDDPAFCAPSKPVGPTYSSAEVEYLSARTYGAMIRDGLGWWRAVQSPAPQRIREITQLSCSWMPASLLFARAVAGFPSSARTRMASREPKL